MINISTQQGRVGDRTLLGHRYFWFPVLVLLSVIRIGFGGETSPEGVERFTSQYCASCHSSEVQKGDFRIDTLAWSLSETEVREQWELVYDYISDGDMPPQKAKRHPDVRTVDRFLEQLDSAFTRADQSAAVGGTPVRRLNRIEYLNTVRDIFGIRMINLPLSFPEDATREEFDTLSGGLFLSPAVMEAYHETATDIANRFVPLPNPPSYTSSLTTATIGGDEVRRCLVERTRNT